MERLIALLSVVSSVALADPARIEQLTGAKGKLDEKEGVFKVSVPRSDLKPVAGGVHLTPPMGLTTWAAFMPSEAGSMEVTALHNHFFWDSPKIMFMHIGGMGEQAKLATAVGKLFAKIKETQGGKDEPPPAEIDPAKTSLDPTKIDGALGRKGQLAGGVYKVTIGRTTKMAGHEIGSAMGVNTWAAFAGSDDQAVVDGDFAMYEQEVQGVLKALRRAGISVVAIHNHMIGESPRVIFLHFWGVGSSTILAAGLKAALQVQGL